MSTPKPRLKLLDLFCKAGGASYGYWQAGFDVHGVDIEPQPHYPFKFIQANALTFPLDGYDVIHASPPCQAHSKISRNLGYAKNHIDLIPQTRDRLSRLTIPWVIENVPGAPLHNPTMLCGSSFGLSANGVYLQRHRLFESNFSLASLPCKHAGIAITICGNGTPKWTRDKLGHTVKIADKRAIMGIFWMSHKEIAQAIPPAYTLWIGLQLRRYYHV